MFYDLSFLLTSVFLTTVPSWCIHITVFRDFLDRLDSDSLVNAIPSSGQSLFLLVELTTSLLVQLLAHAALRLCRFARR